MANYRFNLELTPKAKSQLDKLQIRSDAASLSEVIRRALAAYDFLSEHKSSRWEFIMKDKETGKEKVIELL